MLGNIDTRKKILNLSYWSKKKSIPATSSISFDGSHSSPSSIALAIAEALCSIDEDHKHTAEIEKLVAQSKNVYTISDCYGLADFPEFAEFFEEVRFDFLCYNNAFSRKQQGRQREHSDKTFRSPLLKWRNSTPDFCLDARAKKWKY